MDSPWLVNVVLFWILTLKISTISTCSDYTKLTNADGDLTSPEYPKYNPKATRCRWLIIAETGYVITLQFEAFDVGQSTECSKFESRKTYLEVRDGANTSLGTYCGSDKPGDVRSNGNQMWVEYVTNGYKSTMFVARYQATKESSLGTIVAFVIAVIFGTIICIIIMIVLIKRKNRDLDNEMNIHASPSRDSNNDIHRTCSLAQVSSLTSLGNVTKGMDDYAISQSHLKYSSKCKCNHGYESHSHSDITESHDNRNQQEFHCHDNSSYHNRNNHKVNMATIDVDSKHSFREDRLSPKAVTTNVRKPSESESIITTAKVIFVQDSSSSRSASSSSNE